MYRGDEVCCRAPSVIDVSKDMYEKHRAIEIDASERA
jgi:hypothetical protein